jgi:hypothetical protein
MNGSSTRDSAPSEARKRGSGGGSPRKHDDLLTGPSDLVKAVKELNVSKWDRLGKGIIAKLTYQPKLGE